MTGNSDNTKLDFLCEKKLRQTDDALYTCFRNSVFAVDVLLAGYKNIFPFYTDHTFEHSEQVINYCNIIAGEEIVDALNPDEIYILLMGASLHDIGMGISEKDFKSFLPLVPGLPDYVHDHPDESSAVYTRNFHQELSAQFIRKYSGLFEIPSPEHIHCIAQIARGHRKADLLDETDFPTDYLLPNGRRVNLAYLAALVKLADELDVTADRNLLFDYTRINESWSEKQTMCYKCHGAIKKLDVRAETLVLFYDTDEPAVEQEILQTRYKVGSTFSVYYDVVGHRTRFHNSIKAVQFEKL